MQNNLLLIGLVGRKRHGKDTVADYLTKNYNFTKDSFAGPLKETLKKLFLFSEEQVNGDLKEVEDPRWKLTPRKALQHFGTEIVRNQFGVLMPHIGHDFWVQHFKFRLPIHMAENRNRLVLSDTRFPNESKEIKNRAGLPGKSCIIKIVRPSLAGMKDEHESELLVDKMEYDYLIVNDGTLEDLYKKIDEVMDKILKS